MSVNLKECKPECTECIKAYIEKHKLSKGDKFEVPCFGIPKEYINQEILARYSDPDVLIGLRDPVVWAAKYLKWYCLDPEGEIWKEKTLDGTIESQFPLYDKEQALDGKSPFHRPYQAIALRCNSKRKLFLMGRQIGKTETLVIAAIHAMFTNRKFKVVALAPFQSQVEMLLSRIPILLERNPELYNSIKSQRKTPYYTIELHNGSYIRGFSAGTKSKGEAGSVRGQPAHRLLLDEADYLSPEDMNSVTAVITNFPNADVWMSSTPTGRRDNFYNTFHGRIYKSFHYPSWVNPMWSKELEKDFRLQLTELGYQHEVEASFGEQEEGVYQNRYIDMAKQPYRYEDMKPDPRWTYSFGVDWNDTKVGTVIIVTGFNPSNQRYYVVDKHIVSRAGWTQTAAMQKVIELNRMWRPAFIYIDKGFGHVQTEVLHGFGYEAMINKGGATSSLDSRLANIVKTYDFGSSIEIRDLFTKQPKKKPAKAFLVENAVRKFERNQIFFPRDDKNMIDSLGSYIIKNISIDGTPRYATINDQVGDHLVDALNLSLIGFTLEGSALGKPKFSSDVAFSGQFGESATEIAHKRENNTSNRGGDLIEGTDSNRTKYVDGSVSTFGFPTVNRIKMNSKRIWNWPGFLRDEPPPRSQKSNPRRGPRPSRKNI